MANKPETETRELTVPVELIDKYRSLPRNTDQEETEVLSQNFDKKNQDGRVRRNASIDLGDF